MYYIVDIVNNLFVFHSHSSNGIPPLHALLYPIVHFLTHFLSLAIFPLSFPSILFMATGGEKFLTIFYILSFFCPLRFKYQIKMKDLFEKNKSQHKMLYFLYFYSIFFCPLSVEAIFNFLFFTSTWLHSLCFYDNTKIGWHLIIGVRKGFFSMIIVECTF